MRPSHPCLVCGHRSASECDRAADGSGPREFSACAQCGHVCLKTWASSRYPEPSPHESDDLGRWGEEGGR